MGDLATCLTGDIGNGALVPVYTSVRRPVSHLSRRAEQSKPSFHDSVIFPLSSASLKPPAPELSAFSSSSVPSLPPFKMSGAHGNTLLSIAAKTTTNGKFPSVISAQL